MTGRAASVLVAAVAVAGSTGCGRSTPAKPKPATVSVTDNAFARGGRERPVVRVAAGRAVRWVWRAQESHQLTVLAGPERFASRTQTRGSFTHTFSRRGTYRLECSLHAPGMRMTVVVS